MKRYAILFSILLIVSACSVQKRLHNPGLSISWSKHYKNKPLETSSEREQAKSKNEYLASSNNEYVESAKEVDSSQATLSDNSELIIQQKEQIKKRGKRSTVIAFYESKTENKKIQKIQKIEKKDKEAERNIPHGRNLSIAGLVLGLVASLFFTLLFIIGDGGVVGISIFFSLLGIVFSGVGFKITPKEEKTHRNIGLAGIVISGSILLFWLIAFIVVVCMLLL